LRNVRASRYLARQRIPGVQVAGALSVNPERLISAEEANSVSRDFRGATQGEPDSGRLAGHDRLAAACGRRG